MSHMFQGRDNGPLLWIGPAKGDQRMNFLSYHLEIRSRFDKSFNGVVNWREYSRFKRNEIRRVTDFKNK